MTPRAAHQSGWETSEVVFGIPLLVSIVLSFTWPLPIANGALRWVLLGVGAVLFISGVLLIGAARREMARFDQPTDPGHPTSRVVRSGVFSISRNPLYLGVVIVVAGMGLALNGWWILILLGLEIILCHIILILPEERYLSSTFGSEYQAYKQSVRRWLGRR